ncbi:MAG: hypothetical protein FWE84_02430 [Firmicutes bacterium]|nr:hypothetical protein [Bacillota bacterium]
MAKIENRATLSFCCPPSCDCEDIENRLTALEEAVTNLRQDIIDINYRISVIESFIYLSDVVEIWSLNPSLSGLGIGVIYAGFTYNFWGIGALDHQQTLTNGNIYYLITSAQYPPLTYYQGDTTIGTLWIETPAHTVYSFPIRFDATGIYFRPDTQLTNLPVGTTFKFTQTLILVQP